MVKPKRDRSLRNHAADIVQIPGVYLTNPSDGNPETPDTTGYGCDQTRRMPTPMRMPAVDE